MKNYLIFPALLCYFMAEVLTSDHKIIWIILMLLLLLRVILLKRPLLMLLMILLGGTFLIRANNIKATSEINPQESKLVIFPDHTKINGDLLSGDTLVGGQNVRFIYQLKNLKEKQMWQSLSDPVEFIGSIDNVEKIKATRNPGEFDYQKFLSNKNIYYSLKLVKMNDLKTYIPKTIVERINVLRIHYLKKLNTLPKWLKIHSQSLLLGYSNGEEKEFFNSLSVLGIIHLFSLSGLHVLIFVIFFRKFFSTIKVTRELTDWMLLFLLPAYGVLVGSKIGIWRAILLTLIGIILTKSKLQFSSLDIFSLTLMICLFVQPKSILDMGGQLSFLLSFSLLFIYKSSNALMATFKLNLVSLPIISTYTYQFSWLILIANLLFVPFFSYVILPTTILSSILPDLSIWNLVNDFFEIIYSFLENISLNRQFILVTGKFSLVVVLILIVLSLFNLETKNVKNIYLKSYLFVFTMAIIFNKVPLFGQVSLIDVGQGDSILITTPFIRKKFLIDTGGKLSFPQRNWQKRSSKNQVETSTIPYLKSKGINKIDRVFLSHKDVDHVGNLPTLLNQFPVLEVSFGSGLQDNKSIKTIINEHPNIKFTSLKQGDNFETNGIIWNVLWPKKRSIGENGDSLTLLASINGKSWLFTGDLDIDSEKKILNDYRIKIDYLKAGHHGSKTSSGNDLLKKAKPDIAFISAGVNNRYGHPNKETIRRYDNHQIQHMNTADYGMITWYYYPLKQNNKIKTFLKGELIENNRIKK